MFIEELELLLGGTASFEQFAKRPQSNGPVTQGNLTGFIDGISGITVSQTEQAHQHPNPANAPCLQHYTGPALRMSADQGGSLQQPGRTLLYFGDLARMDVLLLGLESSGLDLDVDSDLLHLAVEDANHVTIPADPDLSAGILRRDRVIGLRHFHVTIAMDAALGLFKADEPAWRQALQMGLLLLLKELSHLLTGRAMDAGVGDPGLPVEQMPVLLGQIGERAALEGIIFDVPDGVLHLALCLRCRLHPVGMMRQECFASSIPSIRSVASNWR
jgi:hypothetical protein